MTHWQQTKIVDDPMDALRMEELITDCWGCWANYAADLLGVWVWNGSRDEFGRPCRWRHVFRCSSCEFPDDWVHDWAYKFEYVTDDCRACGMPTKPMLVTDLLDNPLIHVAGVGAPAP